MGSATRTGLLATIAALGGASCGFSVSGGTPSDSGSDVDSPPTTSIASCKELHATSPSTPSGDQLIDPDGTGPDAPFTVTCDMATAGGGWTIVFFASSTNLTSLANQYNVLSPRLLADAQDAMIGYRDAAKLAAPDFAVFALPAIWKLGSPLAVASMDVPVSASVNGAPGVATTLRFGNLSFASTCNDPWDASNGPYGRLCLEGTRAPFYTGYAANAADTCSNSLSVWNSQFCGNGLRFAIAVR